MELEGGNGEGRAVGAVEDVEGGAEGCDDDELEEDEEDDPEAAGAAAASAAAAVVGLGTVGWARGAVELGLSGGEGGVGCCGGSRGRRFRCRIDSVCHGVCVGEREGDGEGV